MHKEVELYEQLAKYINTNYPRAIYHFDLAGIHNPSPVTRSLYSRLNRRGFPDLQIATPVLMPDPTRDHIYLGLFLELKVDGTRLIRRDGQWASEHIAEQAEMLAELQGCGYIAQFAVGLDEATQIIDSYFEGRPINEITTLRQDPANEEEMF